jgi:hypothetical protein
MTFFLALNCHYKERNMNLLNLATLTVFILIVTFVEAVSL